MSLLSETKKLCFKNSIKLLRRRGQNFLINPLIYQQIIKAAALTKNDTVLEIGPGLGTLTAALAQRVKRVIAIEIDKKLIEILKKQLRDYKNIEIIQGDVLELQVTHYKLQDYKVVANLPYNITGAILRKFLHPSEFHSDAQIDDNISVNQRRNLRQSAFWPQPKLMLLMLQKEVAKRIISRPPQMSLLSLMVQFYGQPKIIKIVSKNNFWPRPKVDSAILRITRTDADKKRGLTLIEEKNFFALLRAGFCAPRKFLINNLLRQKVFNREDLQKYWLQHSLNLKIRPQELSLAQWVNLYQFYEH